MDDDKLCEHLKGVHLPDIALPATNGSCVNLSQLRGTTVVYCYPMTSQPGVLPPIGWDEIPGTRGCTLQCCSYRDHFSKLNKLNTAVYGMSSQGNDYQMEMTERLKLPFLIISDSNFEYCNYLNLPTFTANNKRFIKRITLVIEHGVIEAVHYPILQSIKDVNWVIAHLTSNKKN